MKDKAQFINRELSWLGFNESILKEAQNAEVPLIERMRFLGIYSNNLDEFYKVRVASLRRAARFNKKKPDEMGFRAEETMLAIEKKVVELQEEFETTFSDIRRELSSKKIFVVNNKEIIAEHKPFLHQFFLSEIKPFLVPVILDERLPFPQLDDAGLYLAVQWKPVGESKRVQFALIEITHRLNRFVKLPTLQGKNYVMFIEDVIRYFLKELLVPRAIGEIKAFAIRSTRDAELDIDDDVSQSFIEKMTKSLVQRKKGQYVRLNYDADIPKEFLQFIVRKMNIKDETNITAGGRYHRRRDYMNFPDFEKKELRYPALQPLQHERLRSSLGIFNSIAQKDILLQFPYHSFHNVIDLLREAALDPNVRTIRITLYRVAEYSQIINALIQAAQNGKRVMAVVELQARFDEKHNIEITNALVRAGVRVIPGVPSLKVHCKLIHISRKEGNTTARYNYIGTGNFHEQTARIYSDFGLLTADNEIGSEVRKVFDLFANNFNRATHRHLILSPFSTRRKFAELIQFEIENADKGLPAWIILKMNNLVDAGMIRKLYDASEAGVKIKLIIRGVCSLVPGKNGLSENIEVVRVVGRYLEHSRVFVFAHGGESRYYISSADWMTRNIEHRIEVSVPVHDADLQREIKRMLDIQLASPNSARLKGLHPQIAQRNSLVLPPLKSITKKR